MAQVNPQTVQKDTELYQNYLNTYYEKCKNTTGHIKYGTAGFRSHADNLPHVCLRVGIFTGLVAKLEKEKVLGIVITASHNPSQDNGIKQSDFDGGMIRKELEQQVSGFVIEQDLNKAVSDLVAVLKKIDSNYDVNNQGMVFVGRDTRASGDLLNSLMIQGIESVGSLVKDYGKVTTPMIHWFVRYFNLENEKGFTRETKTEEIFETYHEFFMNRFNDFYNALPSQYTKKNDETILLDCSHGIGGTHVVKFLENMKNLYNVIPINTGDLQYLNVDCGAEFVHKKQFYPRDSVDQLKKLDLAKTRCLAFDGDADRIVYYLPIEGFEQIKLLDGDRIISLFALMFQTVFRDIQQLYESIKDTGLVALQEDLTKWDIAMVQTPYANGSSTEYLSQKLKVITSMSPNGVKNLHPRAHKFDVGIYCESNGHGAFVVREEKMAILRSLNEMGKELVNQDNEQVVKLGKLLQVAYNFAATQNQIMGDAMTNFMCIEESLAYLGLSAKDWSEIYQDFKCLNSTVVIRDRSAIKVNETEDKILEPVELQQAIDNIVSENPGSRSFARPSGTEDIVRVYVEHESKEMVDKVTELVKQVVLANKKIQQITKQIKKKMFFDKPTEEFRPKKRLGPQNQGGGFSLGDEKSQFTLKEQQKNRQSGVNLQKENQQKRDQFAQKPNQPQQYQQAPPQQQQQYQGQPLQQRNMPPKQADTLEGEDAIRRFYDQMDQQPPAHQQMQQQQQPPQQQQGGETEEEKMERELRELQLEQEQLEKQIQQRQQENDYYDQLLIEQQKQKQQQQVPNDYESYQKQLLQQQQQQQPLTQQQKTSQQVLGNNNNAVKNTYDQQFDNYKNSQANRQQQRIESGLIGSHPSDQGAQQRPSVKGTQQQQQRTNIFGDQSYNYFKDDNREKIDQHVYGRLKKVPQGFDPMTNYQKQVNSELTTQQEMQLQAQKNYQPTPQQQQPPQKSDYNYASANKYKRTQLW